MDDLVAGHGLDARLIALDVIGPKPGAFAGSPVESAIVVHEDERMEIGVWECTPGSFRSVKDGISEVMQFVSGEATAGAAPGTCARRCARPS